MERAMKLEELNNLSSSFGSTDIMPVLFVGHGSPMNAIEDNIFSKEWMEIGENPVKTECNFMYLGSLGNKRGLCHGHENPRTIHDFGDSPGIVQSAISSSRQP